MPLVFLSTVLCPHGRDGDDCTECRFVSDIERDRVTVVDRPDPVLADADLYLDHGAGKLTYIQAGRAIPYGLVDLPRIPVGTP